MAPATALLLTQKAEVKSIKLPEGALTGAAIKALLKKKDTPEMCEPYSYKGTSLFVFGFTTGKAGTENKHELPPPHDTTLFFGDILLVASKSSKSFASPVSFKPEDYEQFYTKAFGGFEDVEDEDEEDEEEEDEEEEEVEEEEEEEEAAADEDADAEGAAEVEAEVEVEAPKPKRARKITKAAAAAAAQVTYASFVSIHPDQQLKIEGGESAAPSEAHRATILAAVTKLFDGLLDGDEVRRLERCIYNGAIREAERRHVGASWTHPPFVHLYQMHARHISANFHPDSYVQNKELFQKYKKGEVTLENMAEMNTYDLFETRWKDSFEQQQIREKRQLEGDKSMATDQFLCTRCWKRECTYYEMQTRSADEPMTIFITCLNCGKHWRQ